MPLTFFSIISFVAEKKRSDIFSIYIGLPIYLSANVSPNLSAGLTKFLYLFHSCCRFPTNTRYYLDLIFPCPVLPLASLNISQHPQGRSAMVAPCPFPSSLHWSITKRSSPERRSVHPMLHKSGVTSIQSDFRFNCYLYSFFYPTILLESH